MNLGTLAMVAMLTLGQTGSDLVTMPDRDISIPIRFEAGERAQIKELLLFVSRNQGGSWEQEARATPNQNAFVFRAPDDGIYWFNVMVIDQQGRRDPEDIYAVAPGLKVLIDATKPQVRFTNVQRNGPNLLVAWEINEENFDERTFRLEYRTSQPGSIWRPIAAAAIKVGNTQQPILHAGPIQIRLQCADYAGNLNEAVQSLPAREGVGPAIVERPPTPAPAPTVVTTTSQVNAQVAAEVIPTTGMNVEVPSTFDSIRQEERHAFSTQPTATAPSFRPPLAPKRPATDVSSPGPNIPLAVSGASPTQLINRSLPPAEVINVLKFDLAYAVEDQGPSGLGRVELWITRDDGKSWHRWSEDDDLQSPLTVNLDMETPGNPRAEGIYGFRVVVYSGAGLTKGAPQPGDPPDMRVDIDVTPPIVKLLSARPDPRSRDSMILQWDAVDRNLAVNPITLEWSEHPQGPWRPVVSALPPEAPGAALGSSHAMMLQRIPNTGRYAWRLPARMPTHRVYLRITARDAAGNIAEAKTPEPIEVDLNKPAARIKGILGASYRQP